MAGWCSAACWAGAVIVETVFGMPGIGKLRRRCHQRAGLPGRAGVRPPVRHGGPPRQPRGGPAVRRARPSDSPDRRRARTCRWQVRRCRSTSTPARLERAAPRGRRRGAGCARTDRRWSVCMVVAFLAVVAVAAPLVATHDPLDTDAAATLAGPSRAHLLGTDNLGRDVFSRLVFGSRLSLGTAVLAAFVVSDHRGHRGPAGRDAGRDGSTRSACGSSTVCSPFPASSWSSPSPAPSTVDW